MYLSDWQFYGMVFVIVYLVWGQWNMHRQITVIRGCYLEIGDWAQEIAQDLDRIENTGTYYEDQWEGMVRRHGKLQRRRGVSMRKNWAEFDVRFEKV